MFGNRRDQGAAWEQFAQRHLESAGLETLGSNFHTRGGELDLVMREGDTFVFVEVRQRARASHGSAIQSISDQKVARIRSAAQAWLVKHRLNEPRCRFDVFCIDGSGRNARFEWIRDAF